MPTPLRFAKQILSPPSDHLHPVLQELLHHLLDDDRDCAQTGALRGAETPLASDQLVTVACARDHERLNDAHFGRTLGGVKVADSLSFCKAALEKAHVNLVPGVAFGAEGFARDVFDRLLIDLSWASSRLEGNTYSRLDTQNLIRFGQEAEGKDGEQAQMILNHKRAIEFLVDEAEVVGFDRRTLTTLHSALSENLLDDPRDEGGIRKRPVRISGTPYVPTAIPQVIEEALDVLLDTASAIPDPFERAFFAMVHIPYLQPFTDVNKRTSRLAANIPLIRANLCPLSFVDVPERAYIEGTLGVYEQNRVELLCDVFVWAYGRSCAQYRVVRESMGQPDSLRLRYREQLAQVVRETVVAIVPPNVSVLRAWAATHGIPADDHEPFAERALSRNG